MTAAALRAFALQPLDWTYPIAEGK